MSELQRLERIRTVTRYFAYWQGLKVVPMGLLCLAVAGMSRLPETNPTAVLVLRLALFTAALLATVFIGAGYKRQFGVVYNPRANWRLDALTLFVTVSILVGLILVDLWPTLPIYLTALGYAFFFVWVRQVTGGGRNHYLWLAAVLLLVSLLPLFGLGGSVAPQMLLVTLGLGLVVTGVLDHLELIRIFRPVENKNGASARD